MPSAATTTVKPAGLAIDISVGALLGSNNRYEKFLPDLAGVYRDRDAFADAIASDDGDPVYWVESSAIENGSGALTVGLSVLEPGKIGNEYAMTRGHLHARAECAELYYGLSGRGVLLMETLDGRSEAMEIRPGSAVHVPGNWIHRSVNVGDERLVTLFCYPTTAGQDYAVIRDAGGMRNLVVEAEGGWTLRENPDHRQYGRARGGRDAEQGAEED